MLPVPLTEVEIRINANDGMGMDIGSCERFCEGGHSVRSSQDRRKGSCFFDFGFDLMIKINNSQLRTPLQAKPHLLTAKLGALCNLRMRKRSQSDLIEERRNSALPICPD